MSIFGGIFWNSSTDTLEISGANINVKDSIHFKDTNTTFNGNYNTLVDTPRLTQGTTGSQGSTGLTGSIGAQGSVGASGSNGSQGTVGANGAPGSASSGFRAHLNISADAEDINDGSGGNSYSGEVIINLPENSSTPTNYVDITYDAISYNDNNFSLNASTGVITVLIQMKAMITYCTTARINNNSYANFFHKLLINTGSGFTEVPNSQFSGNTNRASFAKSTSTGIIILDLNPNDRHKKKTCGHCFYRYSWVYQVNCEKSI